MEKKTVKPVRITAEEFKSLKMLRNQVLIKLERDPFELDVHAGGLKLKMITQARMANHLCTRGTVICAHEHIGWSEREWLEGIAYDWCPTQNEVEPGDTVYMSYMAVMTAYNLAFTSGMHKLVDVEGIGVCIYAHYGWLYMTQRSGVCTMLNGWVMTQMAEEKINTFLYIPESVRQASRRIARVINHNPVPIKYFDHANYFDCDEVNISVGDIVINERETDIPLEGELDAEFEGMYIVQKTNILSVVKDFCPKSIKVKSRKQR